MLGTALDRIISMDMYEKRSKIPENVGISTSRLDIFLFLVGTMCTSRTHCNTGDKYT